jgi:hypothetical protein
MRIQLLGREQNVRLFQCPMQRLADPRRSSFRFRHRQVPLSYFVRSTVSICRLGLSLRPFAEAKYMSVFDPYFFPAAMSRAVQ